MTQRTGRDSTLFYNMHDISTDGNRVSISESNETPEHTTFQPKGGTRQRIGKGVLKDWNIAINGFFNDVSPSGLEPILTGSLGSGSIFGVYLSEAEITGACVFGYEGVQIESAFNIESPVDGMTTLGGTITGSGPLYKMKSLTGGSIAFSAGSYVSNSIDLGGSRATLEGVVRVYNETGMGAASAIMGTIQHSANDSAWSDLAAFDTTFAASGFEIKQFTSCSQYIRIAACPTAGVTGTQANFFASVER